MNTPTEKRSDDPWPEFKWSVALARPIAASADKVWNEMNEDHRVILDSSEGWDRVRR